MNQNIAKAGALIVVFSVLLFGVCMLIPFDFGSYFVCMLLAIGYVMMAAGFSCESDAEHRVAAKRVWHSQSSTPHWFCWCISRKPQLSGLTR